MRRPLDPVTVKILWDRLVSIVDQATVTQYRTAFSTVVREANDFACSIMDARGATLANSEYGLPSFAATQAITLQSMLEIFPLETLQPGDVLITNDPWIATGQVMDITILAPIFKNGRVVAFGGSVAHSPELGGVQQWTLATDVYGEALMIPRMKLYAAGRLNDTLWEMIQANSRTADLTLGDLEAQLAATRLIGEKVVELMDEYELLDLEELEDNIYSRSEALIRSVIRDIPDDTYEYELTSDAFTDAENSREPAIIKASVTVTGSDVIVDYSGSSLQRPLCNSIETFTWAYSTYGLRLITVPYVPQNAGFYRPLKVIAPEGTIVNARRPASTLNRHIIGHQVCDAIYGALAPVIPTRVMAQGGSSPAWILLLIGDDVRGQPFHRLLPLNGGLGAFQSKDGEIATFPANHSNTPIEVLEGLMPLICECKEVIADSEGAGRYRGGFGQRVAFKATMPVSFAILAARVYQAPLGLIGGLPGRHGHVSLNGEPLAPGASGRMSQGDRLIVETPGGGGKHPPGERDTRLIVKDIEDELVSGERAMTVYGSAGAAAIRDARIAASWEESA